MFYVKQNESTASLKRVPILMVDETDGATPETGLTLHPEVSINGGAYAGAAGTWSEVGYGVYYYQFDASEISTLGYAGIHVTASGARNYDAIAQIAAFNMYSAAGVGITAGDVWSYDISGVTGAGLAGSQLNAAAAGGAGLTSGDVWSYNIGGDPAETVLSNAAFYSNNASSQTSSSAIRDAVWDTDLSFLVPSTQAAGWLYSAAVGATTSAEQVWNYDISAISTAGTAGSQLNLSALPNAGSGLTAGDVWDFNVIGFGATGSAAVTLTQTLFTTGNIETYVANQTPQDVWTYAGIEGRTITGGSVTSVVDPVSVSATSMSGIAGSVWNYDLIVNTPISNSASWYVDLTKQNTDVISTQTYEIPLQVWSYDPSTGGPSPAAGSYLIESAAGTTSNAPSEVWNYATRTLTSGSGITAGDVWTYDVSTITTAGTAGSQLNLAALSSAGSGLTAGDVWDYDIINNVPAANSAGEQLNFAKFYADTAATNTANIAENVWTYDPSLVGPIPASGGYLIEAAAGTTANDAASVWSYATRTLTSAAGATAGDVWSYADRTITGGSVTSVVNPVSISSTSMSGIAGSVWNSLTASYTANNTFGKTVLRSDVGNKAGDVTLRSSGGINMVDADVHRIDNDVDAATNLKNALTGIGASWTGNVVGNVTGTVDDVVQPVDVSTASMSGIANTVWTSVSKTITGGTVDTVTNPVSVASGSMTGIAGTVWSYPTRTITSGAGATAGDIWTYNIASITASGTAGATLNDASVSGSVVTIVNGPYRLTSIAEGTDGRIDILADSVQTIQLNCLDGFGQPFNVTGYTAAVNVYDVSGALTVTYTPTVDFASSGIVSFDIDTDVTGTTGRYTLVVELTAGAEVVQLGPLEILVRPL